MEYPLHRLSRGNGTHQSTRSRLSHRVTLLLLVWTSFPHKTSDDGAPIVRLIDTNRPLSLSAHRSIGFSVIFIRAFLQVGDRAASVNDRDAFADIRSYGFVVDLVLNWENVCGCLSVVQ